MNKIIMTALVLLALSNILLWKAVNTPSEYDMNQLNHILTLTAITTAIGEDYPPKMRLGEREWCRDRSCINE
jgi:hypothetical protein